MPHLDVYGFVYSNWPIPWSGIPNAVTTYHRHHPARCHHRVSYVTLRIVDASLVRTYSRSRGFVYCPSTAFYKGRLGHHCHHNHIYENRYHKSRHYHIVDLVSVVAKLATIPCIVEL